jgi:low affinity Fe/Cu permease
VVSTPRGLELARKRKRLLKQGDGTISAQGMRKVRTKNGLTKSRVAHSPNDGQRRSSRLFSQIATVTSREAGRAWVFVFAVAIIMAWAVTGPFFNFSDTWQLVINTGTTIVTFLMVFLIQNSQNRDAAAIQVKLDELIRASKAQNSFIGLEHLTEEELEEIRRRCEEAAKAKVRAEPTRA